MCASSNRWKARTTYIRLSNPVARRSQHMQGMILVYGIYQITINDPAAICKEMARIRERGYSQEREESVQGGCCFGAAVFSGGNCPLSPHSRCSSTTCRATPTSRLKWARPRVSHWPPLLIGPEELLYPA
ncbi:MAG: IclR family transcriptional regulator C-terminal domain-containing protein [Bryobacteraceae bacterium]|nr:IclR family transcriptional regulator C-terminal domain-containing protein [Bryobacteraceae bacterium]